MALRLLPGDVVVYRTGQIRKQSQLAGFIFSVLDRPAAGDSLSLLFLRTACYHGKRYPEGTAFEEFETCLKPLRIDARTLEFLLALFGPRPRQGPA